MNEKPQETNPQFTLARLLGCVTLACTLLAAWRFEALRGLLCCSSLMTCAALVLASVAREARKAHRTGGSEPAIVAPEPSCVTVGLMLILIPLILAAIGLLLGLSALVETR